MTSSSLSPSATLRRAVMTGDLALTEEILVEGSADINTNPCDLLFVAVNSGDTKMVRLLLKYGAWIDTNPGYLSHAITLSYDEIADALIRHGADVNQINKDHSTYTRERCTQHMPPLHRTLRHTSEKMTNVFLENGADVEGRDDKGDTALSCAVQFRNYPFIERFIKNGANINARNNSGLTILHVAVLSGCRWEVVQLLLDRGADASHHKGKSLVHLAMETYAKGSDKVLELLLEHGYPVDALDLNSETPLHYLLRFSADLLVKRMIVDIVSKKIGILMKNGANVKIKNAEGMTPIALMTSMRLSTKSVPTVTSCRSFDKFNESRAVDYCYTNYEPIIMQIMKLRAMNSPISEEDEEAIKYHPSLCVAYEKYLKQLEKLKGTIVYGTITVAEVYAMSMMSLVSLTKKDDFVVALKKAISEKFLYRLLNDKFMEAERIRDSLREIEIRLTQIFRLHLPDAAIKKIAIYLVKVGAN